MVYEISDLDNYHLSTFFSDLVHPLTFIHVLDNPIIKIFFLMLGVSFTTICVVLSISKTSLKKYRPFDERYFSYDGIGGLQNLDYFQVNN